jgi:hypothetical protein
MDRTVLSERQAQRLNARPARLRTEISVERIQQLESGTPATDEEAAAINSMSRDLDSYSRPLNSTTDRSTRNS